MTSCLSNGSESLQLYYLLVQLKFYTATRRELGSGQPPPYLPQSSSFYQLSFVPVPHYSSKKTLLCNHACYLKELSHDDIAVSGQFCSVVNI